MQRFALLPAIFLLSACFGNGSINEVLDDRVNAGACPVVGSVYDASRIVKFGGETQRYNDVSYTGEIIDLRLFCRYAEEDPVRVNLMMNFAFGRGDKGENQTHDYTYWVAVIRRNGKVLNKEYFTIEADFSDGPVTAGMKRIEEIVIPRADSSVSAANFEVVVGFELTEEQLQFNREGQRFLLNAGG